MVALSMSNQIEINASPATVRSVFLEFSKYKDWQEGWQIEIRDSDKHPSQLVPGDRLKVTMQGMPLRPVVKANTAEEFAWEGSLPGVVAGLHHFIFSPSSEHPGGTTFIQSEDFSGPLTVFFWPWRNSNFSSKNWDSFNQDLKKEAEKREAQSSVRDLRV